MATTRKKAGWDLRCIACNEEGGMLLELNELELISVTCVDCHITFAPSVAARFFARQAERWEQLEQWAASAPVLAKGPQDNEVA